MGEWTNGLMYRREHGHIDKTMVGWMGGWVGGWTEGRMGGWMDSGWMMDIWMDG